VSSVTSSPMPVPNLAGLLSKPSRRARTSLVETPPSDLSFRQADETSETPDQFLPEQPAETPPDPAVTQPATKRLPKTRRSARTPNHEPPKVMDQTLKGRSGREYKQSISYSLPRSIYEAVSQAAQSRQTTITALILEALNSTHKRLGDYLTNADEKSADDLFSMAESRTVVEPVTTSTIRVTDSQLGAMKMLSDRYSVPRTKLLAAALSLYLGPP